MTAPKENGDSKFADLTERSFYAVVFAALAFGAIWIGGWASLIFAMAAGGIMVWEWRRIARGPDAVVIAGFQIVAVCGAAVIDFMIGIGPALIFLLAIALAGVSADLWLGRRWGWSFGGAAYIGLAIILFMTLMEMPTQGFRAVIWLTLIVVATDVGAYFAGRFFGGPKLWRKVSPGKTWSGAVGGAGLAGLAAMIFALGAGLSISVSTILVAVAVSAVSQLGDLGESAYKRRFGVKDSGKILPGHGGLLDRMDGFLAATLVVGGLALMAPDRPVWAW